MIELIIGTVITIVITIMAYLLNRAINGSDGSIKDLSLRVQKNEEKIHDHELTMLKMSGRIDTILELLERVEEQLSRKR